MNPADLTAGSALYIVGDVHEKLATIPDGSIDLIVTSPPFLALRSYLPADHPDKHREIGSEPTPADFLDTLLELSAEWRRVLAPHGSIAIELGDTYSGSGGAGGDYGPDGMRGGQAKFKGSALADRKNKVLRADGNRMQQGAGWPLDKSLTGIPGLYAWSLAYGRNLLTGQESPAGRWRVRNVIPWVRPNPPVGQLGDKCRPATSYITVATLARDRWWDMEACRTPVQHVGQRVRHNGKSATDNPEVSGRRLKDYDSSMSAGTPLLDWWMPLADRITAAVRAAARHEIPQEDLFGEVVTSGRKKRQKETPGAKLLRDAIAAGEVDSGDALLLPTAPYPGAHYATFPSELPARLTKLMCPRQVCRHCGTPRRRIVEATQTDTGRTTNGSKPRDRAESFASTTYETRTESRVETLGWTDCGHNDYRPGIVLDPFAGTGTTLAAATGLGRAAIGIDLDQRNVDLARQRCGMFLEVAADVPTPVVGTPHNSTGNPRFRVGYKHGNPTARGDRKNYGEISP